MYIDIVPNRNSRPAVLLREGWREGERIRKRTLANLTSWPARKVEALRRLLKDEPLAAPGELLTIEETLPHGHVDAVLGTVKHLGLDGVIGSKPSRQRDLVLAMIAEQVIHPTSKLGTTRLWHTTTLASELGVGDGDEDELYEAMDWLVARQGRIEKKLAARHLCQGGLVLYDVTSSYYEGRSCLLARFGHSRDGKKGKPIIVYGVLTDIEGRPVAVSVYPGNTGDPTTVPEQVEKLRGRFGLEHVILAGDRGMLTQTQIDRLKQYPGVGWISALRTEAIKKLAAGGPLQLSLFDETNLAEIASPDFPDERLIACYNPLLAEERARKRSELLAETEKALEKIAKQVARRSKKPLGKAEIGLKVGKIINQRKVGKHFQITIEEGLLHYQRREEAIQREAALDGIYVIRTSEPPERLSAADAVRSYKNLSRVEQAFRSLKSIDLLVRPIRHREERRVCAHIFLCLLAYYVKWHMQKALAPILFDDEELPERRKTREPVAAAKPSPSAKKKKTARTTPQGLPIHSFDTLLAELATRCRVKSRFTSAPDTPPIRQLTKLTPIQQKALELLGLA